MTSFTTFSLQLSDITAGAALVGAALLQELRSGRQRSSLVLNKEEVFVNT